MCEWLSCEEWCDVQLVCPGRTFSAHRAVLASASEFLRNILLSCPYEETPLFIVLPDFDLEAMTSVLYYIYHGEVVIAKKKIQLFVDIVKSLQIFIDNECINILSGTVDCTYLKLPVNYKDEITNNAFILKSNDDDEHGYIKLRKERYQDIDIRLQSAPSDSDPSDKRSCGNIFSYLLDSQAPRGDRQRICFLRDLYIESYAKNGNANGLGGDVLAIPNERYRRPTSDFLTNANGNLPNRVDDGALKISEKIPEVSSQMVHLSRRQQCDSELINGHHKPNKIDYIHYENIEFENNMSPNTEMPVISGDTLESNLILLQKHQQSSLEFKIAHSITDSLGTTFDDTKTSILRTPIFNQVIESPWRPRLPNCYKPFRRKDLSKLDSALHTDKSITMNDSNNNIQELVTVESLHLTNGLPITTEDFVCHTCSQVFTCEESLSAHMKRHAVVPRYSCSDCGKTFSQLRNFKYHMSVHRGTREFAATCTVCGKYFNDRGYLSSHMKIHRNRKEYKCSMCPKSFNQRVAYNMHVRIHTGVKPHVCDECGKAFSRKMLLKQHQRTHSGERPYACPHCDKRFADRSNMTLHLRLHTGVKPFSCSLCPKSFTKKHHLKSHLNFHTGAKPYSCPRCHLAFTQSSNMRTHLKKCSAPETNTQPMSHGE